MNLEQIKQRHARRSSHTAERFPRCDLCGQWWPCDAREAVARVEELEAALRDADNLASAIRRVESVPAAALIAGEVRRRAQEALGWGTE